MAIRTCLSLGHAMVELKALEAAKEERYFSFLKVHLFVGNHFRGPLKQTPRY